jgi:UDP-N-acetylmuramoyl-L-alanyl-D-glutamate--2,6-diaminopimelate ligase
LVDYAHSEDALRNVLGCLRPLVRGSARLICVFGCGGDRDSGKRAPMGAAVGELADVCVVTSDNPRGEDPEAIIAEVLRGLEDGVGRRGVVHVEVDRRRAIAWALAEARRGDVVLLAGKGHETTQNIGNRALPFDDRSVALELLARRGHDA